MDNKQLKQVKKTIEELSNSWIAQYDTEFDIAVDDLNKDVVLCRFFKAESMWEMYDVKIPKKKPYTAEYVLERISKQQNIKYVNYTDLFSKVIKKLDMNLTATSYGFGMDSTFSSHKGMHDQADKIKEVLNELKIAYSIGVSDASWVFRFKISKSASNIKLLQKLIK